MFLYAIFVTIIVVLVTTRIGKVMDKLKEENEEKNHKS
jgi:hypothetical protein